MSSFLWGVLRVRRNNPVSLPLDGSVSECSYLKYLWIGPCVADLQLVNVPNRLLITLVVVDQQHRVLNPPWSSSPSHVGMKLQRQHN